MKQIPAMKLALCIVFCEMNNFKVWSSIIRQGQSDADEQVEGDIQMAAEFEDLLADVMDQDPPVAHAAAPPALKDAMEPEHKRQRRTLAPKDAQVARDKFLWEGAWGCQSLLYVPARDADSYVYVQGTRVFHALNSRSGCVKRFRIDHPDDDDYVMQSVWACRHWLNCAKAHGMQRQHMQFGRTVNAAQLSIPPSSVILEQRLDDPPGSVLTDVELMAKSVSPSAGAPVDGPSAAEAPVLHLHADDQGGDASDDSGSDSCSEQASSSSQSTSESVS